MAINNAGESADRIVITLIKPIGKQKVKYIEIPRYA